MSFDASLPRPYKDNWREAYRYDKTDLPRLTSYQAPGKDPLPFVFDSFRFSGGQTIDTAEYPFNGLWSNERLNEKPQSLSINGFIRGDTYIKNRNAMIEALRITTDDDNPAYLDLPLWGRFPVVLVDYDIDEKSSSAGECAVSLTLKRAGVSVTERETEAAQESAKGGAAIAAKELSSAAVKKIDATLSVQSDTGALAQFFTEIKKGLLDFVGRVQGSVTVLNTMTSEVMQITSLVAQGIRAPRDLAAAVISSFAGIVAGIAEITGSFADTESFFTDNVKNILMNLFSAHNYTFKNPALTQNQYVTQQATLNLYRTACFCAAAELLVDIDATNNEIQNLWALFARLADSIDQNDPDIYRLVMSVLIATQAELAGKDLSGELYTKIAADVPLLYLAHYLSCDESRLRRFNFIEDSFCVQGNVTYV